MDIFTEMKERLRLKVLEEYTTQELLAEIERRERIMAEIIYEDDYIQVLVLDDKGAGGAHHKYSIVCKAIASEKGGHLELGHIQFQKGAILENGVNGITNEALLAIVGHRLECFQEGPFSSDFNKAALSGVDFSKTVLEMRTRDRKDRGVEGQTKA